MIGCMLHIRCKLFRTNAFVELLKLLQRCSNITFVSVSMFNYYCNTTGFLVYISVSPSTVLFAVRPFCHVYVGKKVTNVLFVVILVVSIANYRMCLTKLGNALFNDTN